MQKDIVLSFENSVILGNENSVGWLKYKNSNNNLYEKQHVIILNTENNVEIKNINNSILINPSSTDTGNLLINTNIGIGFTNSNLANSNITLINNAKISNSHTLGSISLYGGINNSSGYGSKIILTGGNSDEVVLSLHSSNGMIKLYSGENQNVEKISLSSNGNVIFTPQDSTQILKIHNDGLDIYKNLNVSEDINYTGKLYVNDRKFYNAVFDSDNDQNIFYMKGNVGIGTTQPEYTLHVNGDTLVTGTVSANVISAGSLNLTGDINFLGDLYKNGKVFSGGKWIENDSENGNIYYSRGNVGIGTTDPQKLLDVNGDVFVTGTISANTISAGNLNLAGDIIFLGDLYKDGKAFLSGTWIENDSENGSIYYSGGNVGIGTTNPQKLLDVNGDVFVRGTISASIISAGSLNLTDDINFLGDFYKDGVLFTGSNWNKSDSENRSIYYSGGNVGIGTTSPQQSLHVVGDTLVTGDVSVGSLTLTNGITLGNSIIPSTTEAYDLGSSTNRFRDLYLSGNTIDLGGSTIYTDDTGNISIEKLKVTTGLRGKVITKLVIKNTISAGGNHSLALDNSGRVWAWGYNNTGKLGNNKSGNNEIETTPINVSEYFNDGDTIVQISAGVNHSLALDEAGDVWGWGSNNDGQVGNNSIWTALTPQNISDISGNFTGGVTIVQVSAGYYHNLVLDNTDHVWAWGRNRYGELGNRKSGAREKETTPQNISEHFSGARVLQVSAGEFHSLAVDDTGDAWAWGRNEYGELGNDKSGQDEKETTPKNISEHFNGGATVVQVSAGGFHSLAVDDRGRVWSWGYNGKGQLGNNSTTNANTPQNISEHFSGAHVVQVSAGYSHSLALDDSGRVWSWGDNGLGQLGNGKGDPNEIQTTPQNISEHFHKEAHITQVSAGRLHNLALDDSGRMWAWGSNKFGQLGNGESWVDNEYQFDPYQTTPQNISEIASNDDTDFKDVSIDTSFTHNLNIEGDLNVNGGIKLLGNENTQIDILTKLQEIQNKLANITTKPSAVSDVNITDIGTSGATVIWDDAQFVALPEEIYTVYININDSIDNPVQTYGNLSRGRQSQVVTGLNAYTDYYAVVKSENIIGSSITISDQFKTLGIAPSAPTNVTVTVDGSTEATVTWDDAQTTGAPEETYNIYISIDDSIVNSVQTFGNLSKGTTSQTISNLQIYTDYYAIVESTNTIGSSTTSSPQFKTLGIAPSAPTNVTVGNIDTTTATVTWSDPVTDGIPEETYTVYISTDDSIENSVQTFGNLSKGTTSQTISNLQIYTDYYAIVESTNTIGSSTTSSPQFKTLGIAPSAPTNVTVGNINTTTATVTWSDPVTDGIPEETYTVYISTDDSIDNSVQTFGNLSKGIQTQSITDLEFNTTYYAIVQSNNMFGSSTTSSPQFKTLGDIAPGAPTNVTVGNIDTTTATVTWSDSVIEGIPQETYTVYINTNDSINDYEQKYSDIPKGIQTKNITGLNAYTTYYAIVQSINTIDSFTSSSPQFRTSEVIGVLSNVTVLGDSWGNARVSWEISTMPIPNNYTITIDIIKMYDYGMQDYIETKTVDINTTSVYFPEIKSIGYGYDAYDAYVQINQSNSLEKSASHMVNYNDIYGLLDTLITSGDSNGNAIVSWEVSTVPVPNIYDVEVTFTTDIFNLSTGTIESFTETLNVPISQTSVTLNLVTLYGTFPEAYKVTITLLQPGFMPITSDYFDMSEVQNSTSIQISRKTISGGTRYHSIAIDESGRVWAWGSNSSSQVGNNSGSSASIPQNISGNFGSSKVVEVSGGHEHSLALDDAGRVWAWGYNFYGQLGIRNNDTKSTPQNISDIFGNFNRGATIVQISAGNDQSFALDINGNVWAWGYNAYGQLGNGTTTHANSPQDISGRFGTSEIIQISCGRFHTVALDSNGEVWTWGRNNYGQLGNGTNTNRNTPQIISSDFGGAQIIQVSAGWEHSLALDANGSIWAWGKNYQGVNIYGDFGTSHIDYVSAGREHNVALDKEGQVWTWGQNNQGQLGNASYSSSGPINISARFGGSQVVRISTGQDHCLAVDSTGSIWSWGSNYRGQLGINEMGGNRNTPQNISQIAENNNISLFIGTTTNFDIDSSNISVTVPSSPRNISVSQITSIGGIIQWDDAETPGVPEEIYTIYVNINQSIDNISPTKNYITRGTNSYTVNNLSSNTSYYVTIIANNNAGSSNPIYTNFVTKQESPPSSPRNISVTQVTSTGALILWDDAETPGDPQEIYSIYVTTSQSINNVSPTKNNITRGTNSYNVDNLSSNTSYYVTIIASNNAGSSNPISTSFTTQEPPSSEVGAISLPSELYISIFADSFVIDIMVYSFMEEFDPTHTFNVYISSSQNKADALFFQTGIEPSYPTDFYVRFFTFDYPISDLNPGTTYYALIEAQSYAGLSETVSESFVMQN